jgi:hypothetical protein
MTDRAWFRMATVAGMALVLAGCSSSHRPSISADTTPPAPTRTAPTTTASTTTASTTTAGSAPVWLCRPGATPDPCVVNQMATAVSASGARSTEAAAPSKPSPFDCFYVYPTVSGEQGPNADLQVQPAETAVAEQQAARFSSVCQVWAPMYRQVTLKSLTTGGLTALDTAYDSLLADWQYYLQHENHGRPVIFIGHSHGSAMLIRLIAEQVDPNPARRAQMVVAIIAGGNVQVRTGQTTGGSFQHIPLCTSRSKAGCVIAYSTFDAPPPPTALFGRPGQGVSLMSLQTATADQQVACVNPAALGGGPGALAPYFWISGSWITYPGLYRGACESAGGATWLQVTATKTAGDSRPVASAGLGPDWGLHIYDVNLLLGNLVSDVSALEAAYRA